MWHMEPWVPFVMSGGPTMSKADRILLATLAFYGMAILILVRG